MGKMPVGLGGNDMTARKHRWLIVSLAFGIAYWLCGTLVPAGIWHVLLKGGGVAALALYALERSTSATRPIAMVMVFGALGDMLIEQDLDFGALAFLCGHFYACWFYGMNRRRLASSDFLVAALALVMIPVMASLVLPEQTSVLAYACGLAAMVACAWCSRFPRDRVALGAVLFAASDLALFARMGVLSGSRIPGLLVWPLYYGGQLLIVQGVVNRAQLMITASPSRARGRAATATANGRVP